MRIYKFNRLAFQTLFFILLFFMFSCGDDIKPIKKKNFVIILDLSDRIIAENQVRKDIEDILNIRSIFLNRFTSELKDDANDNIISENSFIVKIAPQKFSNDFTDDIHKLEIDLKGINEDPNRIQEILDEDKSAELNFKKNLENLYKKANLGGNKEDYDGASFWKYFNEDYSKHIKDSADNYFFLITDGYMYFESGANVSLAENTFSDMQSLKKKSHLELINWKKDYKNKGLKMCPVDKNFTNDSCTIFLMQIKPEEANQNEYDFIKYVWTDWLNEMGIKKIEFYKTTDSPSNIESINTIISGSNIVEQLPLSSELDVSEDSSEKNNAITKQTSSKVEKTKTDAKITPPSNESDLITKYNSVLVKESNREKRISYFVTEIYPNFDKISNKSGFKEMITNIKSDLSYLKINNPNKQINGKTYSDYYDQL